MKAVDQIRHEVLIEVILILDVWGRELMTWLQKIRPGHVSLHVSDQHLPSVANENSIKDSSLKQGKYIILYSIRETVRITMEFNKQLVQ